MGVKSSSHAFFLFISKTNKVAKFIDYNNITSQDVTDEFVDLENRIRVKEEVKKRYEEILRSKTKTLTEVLNTERQIQLILSIYFPQINREIEG